LSSGDLGGVDLSAPLSDEDEDPSGEVALQGPYGVEFGTSFGDPASDVVLRSLVGPQASDGDDVERAVGGAITAVKSMPNGRAETVPVLDLPIAIAQSLIEPAVPHRLKQALVRIVAALRRRSL
jgi:hypothetical protein